MKDIIALTSMLIVTFLLVFYLVTTGKKRTEDLEYKLKVYSERIYFEAQRDYYNGIIHINVQKDCWKTTPWDNNSPIHTKQMCKDIK